jgi:hypothetical protein
MSDSDLLLSIIYKTHTKRAVTAAHCHSSFWAGVLRNDQLSDDNDVGPAEHRALAARATEAFEARRRSKVKPPPAPEPVDDEDDQEGDEDESDEEEEDEEGTEPRRPSTKKVKKPAKATQPPEKTRPISAAQFSQRLAALEKAATPDVPQPGLITRSDIRKRARRDGITTEQASMRLMDEAYAPKSTFGMGIPASELAARYGRK